MRTPENFLRAFENTHTHTLSLSLCYSRICNATKECIYVCYRRLYILIIIAVIYIVPDLTVMCVCVLQKSPYVCYIRVYNVCSSELRGRWNRTLQLTKTNQKRRGRRPLVSHQYRSSFDWTDNLPLHSPMPAATSTALAGFLHCWHQFKIILRSIFLKLSL